jgi:hypothetical protein
MTAGIFIDRPIQVIPVIPSDAEREKRCLLLEAELQTRNDSCDGNQIWDQYRRIQTILSHLGVVTSKNNNIPDNDVFCFRQQSSLQSELGIYEANKTLNYVCLA